METGAENEACYQTQACAHTCKDRAVLAGTSAPLLVVGGNLWHGDGFTYYGTQAHVKACRCGSCQHIWLCILAEVVLERVNHLQHSSSL